MDRFFFNIYVIECNVKKGVEKRCKKEVKENGILNLKFFSEIRIVCYFLYDQPIEDSTLVLQVATV